MGVSIRIACSCGYSRTFFFGVGFMYPRVHKNVIAKMKDGKYGEFCRSFVAEHPDGKVNCNKVVLRCPTCDRIETGLDLTMYVVAENRKYKQYTEYNHICSACGKTMELLNEEIFIDKLGNSQIRCPNCGGKLEFGDLMNWD